MGYGMKVSQPGYNVLTAANKNLSFNSDLATHAIYSIVDVNIPNGTAEADVITHNLGYVPKVWIYVYQGSPVFLSRIPTITGVSQGYDYYVTDTLIHIKKDGAFAAGNFKVIIFTRAPIP